MSWILGVDTSDANACVALCRPEAGSAYEAQCSEANSHNESLSRLVQEVCAQAELPLAAVKRLVCGGGPGSFTGLRIGLGFMKGLALALAAPLEIVSSLKADALEFCGSAAPQLVCAAYDARRSELFCAVYLACRGLKKELLSPCIIKAGELVSILQRLASQEGLADQAACCVVGKGVEVAGMPAERVFRARHAARSLCELCAAGGAQKEFDVPELSRAAPQYLRPVAARTIAERRGLEAAS